MMTTNAELMVAGKATGTSKGLSKGAGQAANTKQTQVPDRLKELSVHLELLRNCSDDASRALECKEFLTSAEGVVEAVSITETRNLARVALALRTFLKELCDKPSYVNNSSLRTLSVAVEVLGILAREPGNAQLQNSNVEAIVLDPEIVSSTASCNALRNVDLEPHAFGDPEEALKYLGAHAVDLILLDTSMTGQGGFSVYKSVRAVPQHAETPVIFLSGGAAKVSPEEFVQGGTQILTKPYTMVHYLELALKALSRVLKHRAAKESKQSGSPVKTVPTVVEDFSELQESHTKLQEEHKKLEKELAEAKAELNKEQSKLQERKKLEKELAEVKAELNKEQAKLQEHKKLEKQLAEARAELNKEQEQRRALAKSIDELPKPAEPPPKVETVATKTKAEEPALEGDLEATVAFRAKATADLEQARGERRRAEQRAAALGTQLQELHAQLSQHLEAETACQKRIEQLEHQLREKEDAVARVNSELETLKSEHELAQTQLQTTAELTRHLRDCLSSFELAKQSFKRTQDEMEARLKANVASVTEAEAKLSKEVAERQRLEESLAAAQRSLAEKTQQNSVEFSKLRSELESEQIERKRLEGEAIHARCTNLDSARAELTALNKVRGQLNPVMEKLLNATRRLLEVQLDDATRKQVESVLENAMLMQSSLQDTGKNKGSRKTEKTEPPLAAAA